MSTEKSCESCDCWHENECKNYCDCTDFNEWIPIESTLTPAQKHAEELLEALKDDHAVFINKWSQFIKHDKENCERCQLIAKAEGRE